MQAIAGTVFGVASHGAPGRPRGPPCRSIPGVGRPLAVVLGMAVLASLLAPASAAAAGGEIAVARAGGIDLLDGSGRALRTIVPPVVASYASARDPAWSPDGQRLAYEQGGWLWIANAAGSGRHRVLRGASQPAWSPDGQRLAVVRVTTGGPERFEPRLWLVAPDGSGLQPVPHQHFALAPSWFPTATASPSPSSRSAGTPCPGRRTSRRCNWTDPDSAA